MIDINLNVGTIKMKDTNMPIWIGFLGLQLHLYLPELRQYTKVYTPDVGVYRETQLWGRLKCSLGYTLLKGLH